MDAAPHRAPRRPGSATVVDSFAAYARRRLGADGGRVVVIPAGTTPDVPAETALAIATGAWSRDDLAALSARTGLRASLSGTAGWGEWDVPPLPVTLLDRWSPEEAGPVPEDFDVLAIVATYNEVDVIGGLLDRLVADGIRVHVLDNWSDDGTEAEIAARTGTGRVTWERFPAEAPSERFALEVLLQRVEEVAATSDADWIVNHDADEIRESPWPGVSLRQGLWVVERFGCNCVDHTVLDFRPVDDDFDGSRSLEDAFGWFEFAAEPGNFTQVKAWRRQVGPVRFAHTGGHDTLFEGRRVFPYKFLNRHYPIRSQAHGERKVLRERVARFSPEERARGWHVQYDELAPGAKFLWDPAELLAWDGSFATRYLLERLGGAGLFGNPETPHRPDALEREVQRLREELAAARHRNAQDQETITALDLARHEATLRADDAEHRLAALREVAAHRDEILASERWRVGGAVLAPVTLLRRLLRRR